MKLIIPPSISCRIRVEDAKLADGGDGFNIPATFLPIPEGELPLMPMDVLPFGDGLWQSGGRAKVGQRYASPDGSAYYEVLEIQENGEVTMRLHPVRRPPMA